MGCNSSKKQDVKKDRQRIEKQQQKQPAPIVPQADNTQPPQNAPQTPQYQATVGPSISSTNRTPAKLINSSQAVEKKKSSETREEEESFKEFGKTPTSRKVKEYDALFSIVQQTQQNFIEISHKPLNLDDTAEDRGLSKLSNSLGNHLISSKPAIVALPSTCLPPPNDVNANQELINNLNLVVPQGQITLINSIADRMADNMESFKIKEVGKVVMSFEEMGQEF